MVEVAFFVYHGELFAGGGEGGALDSAAESALSAGDVGFDLGAVVVFWLDEHREAGLRPGGDADKILVASGPGAGTEDGGCYSVVLGLV